MKLRWLLVDLNSFFASCEQQDNPSLRGKPVAVVPMLADSTSVIAASYEAKKFGIKTGTKVYEAKKMCPGIRFVTGDHKKYVEYYHKIFEAIEEVCHVEKKLSIDEVACRLIGREMEYDNAIEIAKKIKKNIVEKVGQCLTSSIGLGPNILVAKMASDLVKPDGLVAIPTEKILEILGPLDIEAMPGVGRNMKCKLNEKGFYKIADFLKISSQELRIIWGSIWGLRIGEELRGAEIDFNRNKNSSYSHEHVLPPHLRNSEGAYQILLKLLAKGCARLRADHRKCNTLGLSIRYMDRSRFEKTIQFQLTNDTFFMISLLKKYYPFHQTKKPVKVSIFISGLTSNTEHQLSFFDNIKNERLNQAMDRVNSRFGPNTLISAGFLQVTGEAKVKIAFNHIPDKDDEY